MAISDIFAGLERAARGGAALSAALALVAATAQPGWAQSGRRRAEPEANPQFQQQLQAQDDAGGGPVGGSALEQAPASSEESAIGRGTVQGIQIGATPAAARPAAREALSPLETRVTVRVKGAPLATFLDTISAQAKINFIITEGLEARRVTAFLQNVTVREALQVLLEIKGLTYQQIGKSNTYVVTPRSKTVENLITRIYTLSYIPLINLSPSTQGGAAPPGGGPTPQAGPGGTPGAAPAGGAPGGGPGGGPACGAGGGGGEAQNIAILNVLCTIMSRNGRVSIEPRTNALVVTDVPEVFPQIEQIIAELDKKAPQVIIEAQIVEINSTRAKDLGFKWGTVARFGAGARVTTFPMVLPNDISKVRFLDPVGSSPPLGSPRGVGGGATSDASSILDLTGLNVTLSAIVARGEGRFLGKPKILTLNNVESKIEITQDTALNTATNSGNLSGVQGTDVRRTPTGLTLKVTPQVNKDGYITMLVNPEYSDITPSAISNQNNPSFDPIKRAATTLVRVKNGQTLVLGGLLRSKETKTVTKVPFLGYIPLIGWLFTNVNASRENTDLVIFITPTLVAD